MLLSIVYRDTEGLWVPWAPPRHQPQLYSLINLLLCFPFTSSEGEPKCHFLSTVAQCEGLPAKFTITHSPSSTSPFFQTNNNPQAHEIGHITTSSFQSTLPHVCFARLVCNNSNLILLLPTTPTKITRITRKYLYGLYTS